MRSDRDLDDISGVLLRTLAEVWMLGLYVLYGGRGGVEHIGGAHVRSLMNLPADAFPKVQAMIDEWEEFNLSANRIKFEDLAPRIGELLEAAGNAESRATMERYYEVFYRGSSLVDAHAELQTMMAHIVPREDRFDVSVKRHERGDPQDYLVMPAVLVGHLAWHVLRAFGFSTSRLEELLGQVVGANEDPAGGS